MMLRRVAAGVASAAPSDAAAPGDSFRYGTLAESLPYV